MTSLTHFVLRHLQKRQILLERFLLLVDPLCEMRCTTAGVHSCMLAVTLRTDRGSWESQNWHADKDCSEEQTARPIVPCLVFCLPVADHSGLGWTKGIFCS